MNSINDVTVIGLTGQSGAGKTTVCDIFKNNGFVIINADTIAREVVKLGTECLEKIGEIFPECISNETGELDRAKLAGIVFKDKLLLKSLNSIMYPYITTKIMKQIRKHAESGAKYILLDAPTLFESRADDFCNYIICIIADEQIRLERIMQRDNISKQDILDRFSSQHTEEFFINHCDIVLRNNSSLEELKSSAIDTVSKIKEMFDA